MAGYLKIHGVSCKLTKKHYLGLFCIFASITYLSCVFFMVAGTKNAFFSGRLLYFYGRNKLPTLAMAIFIFLFFIKIKPFNSKVINKIASATFGVYLLHDSPLLRKYFWGDLFQNSSFQDSNLIVVYSVCVCVFIYFGCTLLDLARQKFVEVPCMKYIDKYQSKIIKSIGFIYDKIRKFIFDD